MLQLGTSAQDLLQFVTHSGRSRVRHKQGKEKNFVRFEWSEKIKEVRRQCECGMYPWKKRLGASNHQLHMCMYICVIMTKCIPVTWQLAYK